MNFKKGIALIVAFLMLVSNAGFAMTVHYCGGKISSVSSGYGGDETCEMPEAAPEKACCAKKVGSSVSEQAKQTNHKKCCSDKTVDFKGKAIDIIAKAPTSEIAMPFLVPVFRPLAFAQTEVREVKKLPSYYCEAHAPPLFKLYNQYVFYA